MPPPDEAASELRRRLQEGYGPDGDWWHLEESTYPHVYRREEEIFASWAEREEGRTLDLGCGTARFSLLLPPGASPLVCSDLSHHMLTQARERLRAAGRQASFVQADAAHPPFRDASFRFVAAMQVLPHLADMEAFFREMARLLPAESSLVLSAGNDASLAELGERLRALPGGLRHEGWRALRRLFQRPEPAEALVRRGFARRRYGDILRAAGAAGFRPLARAGAGVLRAKIGCLVEWLSRYWPFSRRSYLLLARFRRVERKEAEG